MAFDEAEPGMKVSSVRRRRLIGILLGALLVAMFLSVATVGAQLVLENEDCWVCHAGRYHVDEGTEQINCSTPGCHAPGAYPGATYSDISIGDHSPPAPEEPGNFDCVWCHNPGYPAMPQHSADDLAAAHTSTIAGTRCEACHSNSLVVAPHDDCAACHFSTDPIVIAAMNEGDTDCASCHPDYHGSPHGGYSMNTDVCLQCHDIHEAAGDYVLMREETVTAVCATCHTLYQQPPTGAYNPGYSGISAKEMPEIEAYKVPFGQATTHSGHRLGMGTDDIPGGSQGLTAIQYLMYDATVPATEFAATDGLYCASCHTPHGDFGQMMPMSFSRALLSSKPNHVPAAVDPDWDEWCGACHDLRAATEENRAAGIHNHPFSCLICHNDYLYDPTDDFPHTSNVPNLLFIEPDELCLQCHVAGLLP